MRSGYQASQPRNRHFKTGPFYSYHTALICNMKLCFIYQLWFPEIMLCIIFLRDGIIVSKLWVLISVGMNCMFCRPGNLCQPPNIQAANLQWETVVCGPFLDLVEETKNFFHCSA